MTGLRTLVGSTMTQAKVAFAVVVALIGLVAVAFLAPVVPVASADPASDADTAVTQAWDAGGGATGPLGPKDGGVYPVGAGFAQNFAGGKIFFTPETGAHIMRGAILDKYLALGGPADGDLGFPNIDEGDGKAPSSRNTTFSAADNPVIFWTPETDAHVVRGALNAAWDKLGGSAGVLGVPKEDEAYRGDEVTQVFTGGQLTWNRKTGAFTATPPDLANQLAGLIVPGDATTAINMARRAAGGPMGPLGAIEGAQYKIGDDGVGQNYAGGKIFYSPATGANVVTGQVLAKYESVGGPGGDLGFPTSNEADGGLAPTSTIVTFAATDKPVIFWTPDFGAVIVRGAMNAAWAKLGGAAGALGAPTADQTENGNVITQKFNGGAISYDTKAKQFSTEPAGLASQLAGLEVPGLHAQQSPAAGDGSSAKGDKWYQWHRWWLLAIVPVAVLFVAIVVGVILNRRRHGDDDSLDRFDDDFDQHDDDFDDYDDLDADDEDDPAGDGDWAPGEPGHPGHPGQSGSVPLARREGSRGYAPESMWAMPVDRAVPPPNPGVDAPPPPPPPLTPSAPPAADEDAIDTAPTRIQSEPPSDDVILEHEVTDVHDVEADGDHTAAAAEAAGDSAGDHIVDADYYELDEEPASGPPSGRHAAIQLDETASAMTSLRLATEDPFRAPDGYPIKADTKSGLYWLPGNGRYDHVRAEIWFASEEFALTNGFVKG